MEKGQLFLSIFHIHGFHTSVFFPFYLYLVIFKEIHQIYLSTLLAEEKTRNLHESSDVACTSMARSASLFLSSSHCLIKVGYTTRTEDEALFHGTQIPWFLD